MSRTIMKNINAFHALRHDTMLIRYSKKDLLTKHFDKFRGILYMHIPMGGLAL
jgi:hypothetical protein